MKKLAFLYEMRLTFDAPVTEHHFRFCCLPFQDRTQKSYGERLRIEPAGRLHETEDGFGNRLCTGEALGPHDDLKLRAEGMAFVDSSARRQEAPCPLFLFPSPYASPDQGIRRLYEAIRGKFQKDYGQAFQGLSFASFLLHELHAGFSYEPGRTDVHTTAAQALAGGAGVCQDYAHIFIALCRLAKIPARYVAGMMAGEGATHAWAEAWVDGAWVGLDPTNDRIAGEEYIKLCHGRDFGDCPVDRGCFKGYAAQRQETYVKVEVQG